MKALSLLLVIALAGCSHVDTGQIDYRVADSSPTRGTTIACAGTASRCVQLERRYLPFEEGNEPFKAGATYSMEIEQIVIGDNILEGNILGSQLGKSGEFAILANVFEFASTGSDASKARFLQSNELEREAGDPSDVELKLIYYGDDIRKRQPLNFSDIPLQQRSRYNGGSIGIQLAVLEVDTRSGPMSSLLTTLARFGQKAIPVSSEVSDVLFDLGESLFAGGSGDDRLFEYRFVLSRAPDNADDVQANFAPGRYVLRRTANRIDEQKWSDLSLDLNTARLMRGGHEVRDELYMVVNVRRYPDETSPEYYNFDQWSEVRAKLEQADPATKPINDLTAEITTALVDQRSNQWCARLVNRWSIAETRLQNLTARHVPNLDQFDTSGCVGANKTRIARLSDQSERNAQDALREFAADYISAVPVSPAGTPQELSNKDREVLVSRVARYFMPWVPLNQQRFADQAAFDAFVRDAGGGLTTTSLLTAKGRSKLATRCEDVGATLQ